MSPKFSVDPFKQTDFLWTEESKNMWSDAQCLMFQAKAHLGILTENRTKPTRRGLQERWVISSSFWWFVRVSPLSLCLCPWRKNKITRLEHSWSPLLNDTGKSLKKWNWLEVLCAVFWSLNSIWLHSVWKKETEREGSSAKKSQPAHPSNGPRGTSTASPSRS